MVGRELGGVIPPWRGTRHSPCLRGRVCEARLVGTPRPTMAATPVSEGEFAKRGSAGRLAPPWPRSLSQGESLRSTARRDASPHHGRDPCLRGRVCEGTRDPTGWFLVGLEREGRCAMRVPSSHAIFAAPYARHGGIWYNSRRSWKFQEQEPANGGKELKR